MSKKRQLVEAEFLQQISAHEMHILRDDGVYRHLRFSRPGTGCMHFNIITYPGYLCYSGDMGCFVFSRVYDMLEFFRSPGDGPIAFDARYWAEKIQAEDRMGGFEEYCADSFRERIAQELDGFKEFIERDAERINDDDDVKLRDIVDKKFEALKSAITEDVLRKADDGEHAVYQAMHDFEHDDRHWFHDISEMNFSVYTYRFLWCCHALVWAIRQYDKAKAASDAQ